MHFICFSLAYMVESSQHSLPQWQSGSVLHYFYMTHKQEVEGRRIKILISFFFLLWMKVPQSINFALPQFSFHNSVVIFNSLFYTCRLVNPSPCFKLHKVFFSSIDILNFRFSIVADHITFAEQVINLLFCFSSFGWGFSVKLVLSG